MIKTIIEVEGMACGMCEAHINDAVRGAFSPQKVTSSHVKGQTVLITEDRVDEKELKAVIGKLGYQVQSLRWEEYVKKGLLAAFRK